MKDQPLVSVLMTAFNREKHIAEAIESVLASAYQHFELIVVDDCSTDNTFQIAKRFATENDKIKIYKNTINLGQFGNRNRAISLASGEYIKFLDSDDMIYPHGLSVMMKSMQAFPSAGIGFPATDYQKNVPTCLNEHDSVYSHYMGANHLNQGPTATIFKKKAIEHVNGFDTGFGILADSLLNLKIASLYPSVFYEKGLYYWRIHEDQVTTEQRDDVKMIKERYTILKASLAFPSLPLSKNEAKIIENNFTKINLIHSLKFLFKGSVKDAFLIIKNTELSMAKIFSVIFKKPKCNTTGRVG